ncbi:MAG: hypothetical protein ACIALR_09860 [Blastopirellula sp. JB062]
MVRHVTTLTCCLLATSWLIGCGGGEKRPSATIRGTVTLDDQPLTQGSVHFTSPKTGESTYANLGPNGDYEITFPFADIGQAYQISINKPVEEETDAHVLEARRNTPSEVKIPSKYTERTTSGLTLTLDRPGDTQHDIAL